MKKESKKIEPATTPTPAPTPAPAEKPAKKATAGRAAFIHGLRDSGTPKNEARNQTFAKFKCSPALFERIWKRRALGAESETTTPEPEKSTPSKTPPPKKSTKKAETTTTHLERAAGRAALQIARQRGGWQVSGPARPPGV